jgi:predicted permease
MLQDIRVAWRFLGKARTSTTLAVATLGVTVAMCSVAVGVLDETFWRPLTFANGARLATVYNVRASAPQFEVLSYPDYVLVRDRLQDGVDLAAFFRIFQTLGTGEWPTRVVGELVSGNYFAVLGARPFIGRLLTPDDDRIPSGHPVVVLGHDLWVRTFGSDPAIVGKSIRLNRYDYTVVGVAPAAFRSPTYPAEFWIPLMMAGRPFNGFDVLSRADLPFLQTVALPRAGITMAQVQARIQGIETFAVRDGARLTALPGVYLRFWPGYRGVLGRFLGIFAALGMCVLVIACANLAGLLLARSGERQRELAIRQALGATRGQLMRRLVAESFILTVLGGTIGVLLTFWSATLVEGVAVPAPVHIGLTANVRLLAVALAVSLVASLLFTTVFALKGLAHDIRGVLASFAAAVAPRTAVQHALVVAQVAISCLCLTAAGLLVRTALAVDRIEIGFDSTNTVTGVIGLGDQGYTTATGTAFYERLQEDLEQQPQVESVALEWNPPLGTMRASGRFAVAGRGAVDARYDVVGPGYFSALRIPLIAGREFERTDSQAGEPVAIVNETMAARLGSSAVGQTLGVGTEKSPRRIVGVARDVKYNGVTEPAQPFVYLPLRQAYRRDVWVHVRTHAAGAEALLRARLRLLDPGVALSDVHTLSQQLDQARATPRIAARLAGGMAAIAMFLALVGVYGLLAATVDQRKRELSIRAALGATPRDIVKGVALEGIRLTVAGSAIGVGMSFLGSSLLAGLLYGVPPRDPLVFVLVPIAILAVSVPAWLAPARRAAQADPVAILKSV